VSSPSPMEESNSTNAPLQEDLLLGVILKSILRVWVSQGSMETVAPVQLALQGPQPPQPPPQQQHQHQSASPQGAMWLELPVSSLSPMEESTFTVAPLQADLLLGVILKSILRVWVSQESMETVAPAHLALKQRQHQSASPQGAMWLALLASSPSSMEESPLTVAPQQEASLLGVILKSTPKVLV